jgi:hypothetical protein
MIAHDDRRRSLSQNQLHTFTAGKALIEAQHRQGSDACGTGQEELIGDVGVKRPRPFSRSQWA